MPDQTSTLGSGTSIHDARAGPGEVDFVAHPDGCRAAGGRDARSARRGPRTWRRLDLPGKRHEQILARTGPGEVDFVALPVRMPDQTSTLGSGTSLRHARAGPGEVDFVAHPVPCSRGRDSASSRRGPRTWRWLDLPGKRYEQGPCSYGARGGRLRSASGPNARPDLDPGQRHEPSPCSCGTRGGRLRGASGRVPCSRGGTQRRLAGVHGLGVG
jgi:hypothetical protein